MTKHERIILEKLVENPMLSQSELAEMLGLTRSSVSVYISHLMQMGFIRGRGYVIENCDNLYVIGTAGVDHRMVMEESRLLQPDSATILDDCELTVSYGGIAKNVSENLCRLGGRVSCICAVGARFIHGAHSAKGRHPLVPAPDHSLLHTIPSSL